MTELQHMHNIYERLNGRIAANVQHTQLLEVENCSTCTLYTRGGQTAGCEPNAILRTFSCGSLTFPKIYFFYFLFILQSVEIL